MPNISERNI